MGGGGGVYTHAKKLLSRRRSPFLPRSADHLLTHACSPSLLHHGRISSCLKRPKQVVRSIGNKHSILPCRLNVQFFYHVSVAVVYTIAIIYYLPSEPDPLY